MQTNSAFERIGEHALTAMIDDFVGRVTSDTMIGFFFRNFDHDRLRRHEYQFTARALGARLAYEGQPLRTAHAKHPIMGGQFNRRKTILHETMVDHAFPDDVIHLLLQHTEQLRPLITAQPDSACITEQAGGPLLSSWAPQQGESGESGKDGSADD